MRQQFRKHLLVAMSVLFFGSTCVNSALAGYIESKQAFERHDYGVAYAQCIGSANAGNADCQNAIGYLLRFGFGVNKDSAEARRWFQLAASKNNGAAQYNLALMLSGGEGGSQDYQESAKWLLKAAESGNSKAQANLGTVYSQGLGVESNQEKAVFWWKKAAEQGNPIAQNNLGLALIKGTGVNANPALGRLWLDKAASQTADPEAKALAQNNLSALTKSDLPREQPITKSATGLRVEFTKPDSDGKTTIRLKSNDGSGIQSLRVSGKELGSSTNGTYTVTRYVPIGNTDIEVVAIGENGERFTQIYTIDREGQGTQTTLPELDPSRIVESQKRDAVAIIIGAEQYESLPPAEFADHDARSFYDYANKALGVPGKKIMVLTGNKAKRNDILQATRNWLAAEVNDNRTDVFVFYSGHGLASPDGKKRYLLPVDAKTDLLEDTAISQEQLVKIINAQHPRSVTLITDSCYSGVSRTGKSLLASARPIAIYSEAETLPANTTVISSSSGNQVSVSSPDLGHGLFSYFVMKGLEGDADQNGDRRINAQELYAYVADRVSKEAMRRGAQQTPTLAGSPTRLLTQPR